MTKNRTYHFPFVKSWVSKNWSTIIFFLFVFLIALLLAWPSLFKNSDDYFYSFICGTTRMIEDGCTEGAFNNVWQIFHSQYNHFYSENGRLLVHFLVQLYVAFMGYWVLWITEAALFTLLIYLLARLSSYGKKLSIQHCILVLTLFMMIMPFYNLRVLFINSACIFNYLFAGVASLVALLIFKKNLNKETSGFFSILLITVTGLFLGYTQEGFSIPFGAAFFTYFLLNKKQLRFNNPSLWLSLGFWVSNLLLIVSPGSWDRVSSSGHNIAGLLTSRIAGVLYLYDAWICIILFIVFIAVYWLIKGNSYFNHLTTSTKIYIWIGIYNLAFCLAAGLFQSTRIFQPTALMIIIILSIAIQTFSLSHFTKIMGSFIGIIIVISISITCFATSSKNQRIYLDTISQYNANESGIVQIASDDYNVQYMTSPFGECGVVSPNPWNQDPSHKWACSIIPWYYNNLQLGKKPINFVTSLKKLTNENLLWSNDSISIYTKKKAWWIIMKVPKDINPTIHFMSNQFANIGYQLRSLISSNSKTSEFPLYKSSIFTDSVDYYFFSKRSDIISSEALLTITDENTGKSKRYRIKSNKLK